VLTRNGPVAGVAAGTGLAPSIIKIAAQFVVFFLIVILPSVLKFLKH
jgi:hypothetical protein